jgi:hypothetical protein
MAQKSSLCQKKCKESQTGFLRYPENKPFLRRSFWLSSLILNTASQIKLRLDLEVHRPFIRL